MQPSDRSTRRTVLTIAKFALAYARQTEQDHAQLDKARRAGRITAAAGKVV